MKKHFAGLPSSLVLAFMLTTTAQAEENLLSDADFCVFMTLEEAHDKGHGDTFEPEELDAIKDKCAQTHGNRFMYLITPENGKNAGQSPPAPLP